MADRQKIEHFKRINVEKPADIIIRQIRELILNGVYKAEERLPSERELAERFGVGRGHVREAIRRLEFYGVLRTGSQSGSYVTSLGIIALDGLFTNILDLEKEDFASLLDTREILEIHAAGLAAERATEEERETLSVTHRDFEERVRRGDDGLDEDLLFHIRIAGGSHSPVLRSLISIMTPEILSLTRGLEVAGGIRSREALREHAAILDAIISRDPRAAKKTMENHMKGSRVRGNIQER